MRVLRESEMILRKKWEETAFAATGVVLSRSPPLFLLVLLSRWTVVGRLIGRIDCATKALAGLIVC